MIERVYFGTIITFRQHSSSFSIHSARSFINIYSFLVLIIVYKRGEIISRCTSRDANIFLLSHLLWEICLGGHQPLGKCSTNSSRISLFTSGVVSYGSTFVLYRRTCHLWLFSRFGTFLGLPGHSPSQQMSLYDDPWVSFTTSLQVPSPELTNDRRGVAELSSKTGRKIGRASCRERV